MILIKLSNMLKKELKKSNDEISNLLELAISKGSAYEFSQVYDKAIPKMKRSNRLVKQIHLVDCLIKKEMMLLDKILKKN